MAQVRWQCLMPRPQLDELDERAKKRGLSRSAAVREATAAWLVRETLREKVAKAAGRDLSTLTLEEYVTGLEQLKRKKGDEDE